MGYYIITKRKFSVSHLCRSLTLGAVSAMIWFIVLLGDAMRRQTGTYRLIGKEGK